MASTRPVVAIVGGGFTGATIAYHLAEMQIEAEIVVVEPRSALGGGLAYSSQEPAHRINVPATRMSLRTEQPLHFSDWLARTGALSDDADAVSARGDLFPRRAIFGRYVQEHLVPHLTTGRIRHLATRAESVEGHSGAFRIDLADGRRLQADLVVLAMTHPSPALPAPLVSLAGHSALVADPYAEGALGAIPPDANVLIVGMGLTAADVVAGLDRLGHIGGITMLSRHGLRSGRHASTTREAWGDFATQPASTAQGLLKTVRLQLVMARTEGLDWQPVFDVLRTQAPAIWAALSLVERRRLIRHLRSYWDAHRFRIAPQVAAVMQRREGQGTLRLVAGRLLAATPDKQGIEVTYRRRRSNGAVPEQFDAVVNTTGPAHGRVIGDNPAFASLAAAGLISADALGLGLATASDGRALGANGNPVASLYIAGPLARATFGELMGLPEVTRYAEFIAAEVAQALA
ncbi:FAD-dependent oxidoreductase [Devosia sp.]|uniref:FAD/NAD(P)-binding protein n=1 Tax=Devosia sp. TaxID=1871048 RepID=UPI0025B9A94D|nr:FAD-dependent oxidoreductase [Devosia sp.]